MTSRVQSVLFCVGPGKHSKSEMQLCAGPLPKVMPVSLEILNLTGGDPRVRDGTPHYFTGGIPAEWGSMTNLKELHLANCCLDGESLVYVQCLHREQMRESGGKRRERIWAHTRNVLARSCAQAPYRRRSEG